MLTQRHQDRDWERLHEAPGHDIRLQEKWDGRVLELRQEGAIPFWVVAGRQLKTRERMEVLALGTRKTLPDGLTLEEAVSAVREAGAYPVIPWSPGKWMFSRGRHLMEFLEATSGRLALGDTAMRATPWPEPTAFRASRAREFPVVAGSDPLPQTGDHRVIGQYGIVMDTPAESPAKTDIFNALDRGHFEIRGQRRSLPNAFKAQFRHLGGRP